MTDPVSRLIANHKYKDLIYQLHTLRSDLDHVAIEVMFPSSYPFTDKQYEELETLTTNYSEAIRKIYENRELIET